MSSLARSVLPQSHRLALTRFNVLCSPPDNWQVGRNGQGCTSPPCHTQPSPQCGNKAPCGKNTNEFHFHGDREGKKVTKTVLVRIMWGLYGTTSADLVLGLPCNLLGKQASEEETLVSKVRHTDLVRQISRQTLKLCTAGRPTGYLGFEMRKWMKLTRFVEMCFLDIWNKKVYIFRSFFPFKLSFQKYSLNLHFVDF